MSYVDECKAFARREPIHGPDPWSQWCASAMWRICRDYGTTKKAPGSAKVAAGLSKIVSTIATLAPAGAFHWWDIGPYWHVAFDMDGGGDRVFMASRHLRESYVRNGDLGETTAWGYSAATDAKYLGWSMDYAGSTVKGAGAVPAAATKKPSKKKFPDTGTTLDGIPGTNYWRLVQELGRRRKIYAGKVDGGLHPGLATAEWKLMAAWMNTFRLQSIPTTNADKDGVPGQNFWWRGQLVGRKFGYSGPEDHKRGPFTLVALRKGFAAYLNKTID